MSRSHIPFALGALLLASALPASAQPGPRGPGGGGPGMMMGPGMMGERGLGFMCNPRSAGMAEWRVKRIEEAVKPTDAQKARLEELRAASTKAAEILTTACGTAVPSSSVERLAAMEKRTEALQQAVRTIRPAFEAFYNSLDQSQKAALDAAGPRRWGWHNWRWRWN
jgi:hypothetical protein